MSRFSAHLSIVGLLGSFLVVAPSSVSRAVELRTTSGDRTIVRNASVVWRLDPGDETTEGLPSPLTDSAGEAWDFGDFGWEQPEYSHACGIGSECGVGPSCQVGYACCDSVCVERFWAELEFLLWWREDRSFPPLVTGDDPGILPDATVLFGGGWLSEQARPGGRLQFGMWLDDCQCLGAGGRFLSIGDARTRFQLNSGDEPFFARPFFDIATNQQTAMVIDNLGSQETTEGQLDLVTESEFLAADAFLRCLMLRTGCSRLDFLFGYQFGHLKESLLIETSSTVGAGPAFDVRDSFLTQNQFHGGHFGLQGQYQWGILGVEMMAKFGFGNMHQAVILDGSSTGASPNSGLLVQELTNEGTHKRDVFSYMHDTGIRLAYYPTERIKLSLGYSLIFFSNVLRPGDQVDTTVDGRLFSVPPPANAARPAQQFQSTHFYAHGLTLGLECRF